MLLTEIFGFSIMGKRIIVFKSRGMADKFTEILEICIERDKMI